MAQNIQSVKWNFIKSKIQYYNIYLTVKVL